MSEIKHETSAPKWKDYSRGDQVIVNSHGSDDKQGRRAICIADNTTSGFGHKHVQVQFDDNGEACNLRTYELDLVCSWEEFATSIGRKIDHDGLPVVGKIKKQKIVDAPQA